MTMPNFNLNHFKVFLVVYQTRSMTTAAGLLNLTQSGVSQHVKALEGDLKAQLFTRAGRQLIPTGLADQIFPELHRAFTLVTAKVAAVKGIESEPAGLVRIGMPIEFGNNVLVPKLARVGLEFRKLTFEITLDHSLGLTQKMVDGHLDFAFIDETPPHRRLLYETVASENMLLCASRAYMDSVPGRRVKYTQSFFEDLDYIEYSGSEPILRRWMLGNLKRKNLRLNVRARILDVHGIAKFITSGLGAGVLPDHLVERLKREGFDLYVFEGRAKALRNDIRLVRMRDRPLALAAKTTVERLKAL